MVNLPYGEVRHRNLDQPAHLRSLIIFVLFLDSQFLHADNDDSSRKYAYVILTP